MRLQLKILLWIVVITVVVGWISVYTLTLFQRQTAQQQYSSMARTLSATILNSLETTMIRNNPSETQEIIRRIKAEAIIQKVTIYAADGRVWTSSEMREIGQVVREAALQEAVATGSPTTAEYKEAHQLVVFTPIVNKPSCRSCHAKEPAILGAIGVTLGTAPFHSQVTRIARELHDEVTQSLTGLVMSLNATLETAPEELKERLVSMRAVTEATLEEVRRIVHALRPSILDDLGLVHALRWHAKTYLEEAGVTVNFQAIGLSEARLPSALETAIFRVAQEAITNIARHAQAKNVDIRLELRGDRLSLLVQDDGVGFDEASVLSQKGRPSLGLLGMRERVNLLGGQFHIESKRGRGTKISLEVPVGKEE